MRWLRHQVVVAADWLKTLRFPQNNGTPPSFADLIFKKCFPLLAMEKGWNGKGTLPRLTEWGLSRVAWRLVTRHTKLGSIVWRLRSVPDCLVSCYLHTLLWLHKMSCADFFKAGILIAHSPVDKKKVSFISWLIGLGTNIARIHWIILSLQSWWFIRVYIVVWHDKIMFLEPFFNWNSEEAKKEGFFLFTIVKEKKKVPGNWF